MKAVDRQKNVMLVTDRVVHVLTFFSCTYPQSIVGSGRSFSTAMMIVWNSIPEAICFSSSLMQFRKLLKTELFT